MMIQQNNLRVAITGANGFVAKNIRIHLHKSGLNLISISRNFFKTYQNEKKIISSNLEEKKVLPKVKNCNALIHLIGIGKQTTDSTFENVNVNQTKKVIDICKKAKIKKIIYLSGLGVSNKSASAYFISKYNAEKEIINSGLDYTIFRPSYIIGKDDPLTKNLKQQIKKRIIIIPGSGNYYLQPIFVGDVAKIILEAIISKKFSKKIIDLVGPETISYIEYVKIFKNKKIIKIKNIDLEKAYHEALHNPKSIYGFDDLNIMVGDFTGNHKKLKKISGINFKKFRKVLQSGSLT